MRKPKAPCNGCERRRFRCHSMCVEYAAFCYDNEAYLAMIHDNKGKTNAAENVAVQRSTRAKKAAGMVKK